MVGTAPYGELNVRSLSRDSFENVLFLWLVGPCEIAVLGQLLIRHHVRSIRQVVNMLEKRHQS